MSEVTWAGIVKVQRPVMTNDPTAGLLIYSEHKTIFAQLPPPNPEVVEKMGDRMKVFFHAERFSDGILSINDEANWQEW